MLRGTTPTHIFETNVDLTHAAAVYVTYSQGKCNKVVLEKGIDDLKIVAGVVEVSLSQADTLKFDDTCPTARAQVRALLPDGTALATDKIPLSVRGILKDGVI